MIVFALEMRRREEKISEDEMGWIFNKECRERERAVFLLIFKTDLMDSRDCIWLCDPLYIYIYIYIHPGYQ